MSEFEFKEAKPKKAKVEAAPEADKNQVLQLKDGESTDYDSAELDAIFDQLMFEGQYLEDVSLGKGRFKATLRTRSGKDARAVMDLLDKLSLKMGITVESYRSMYNLAQSLVVLNGRDLSAETLERRIEAIEDLPTPVISALMTRMIKFELKTEAAIRHGEENF